MVWFDWSTQHANIDQYLRHTGIELETYVCNDVPVVYEPNDYKHLVHRLLAAYIQQSGRMGWSDRK
jgi:hypothetical protein